MSTTAAGHVIFLISGVTRAALGTLCTVVLLMNSLTLQAQPEDRELTGQWVLNEDLSENTDDQVEAALKAAGQRVQNNLFDFSDDKYRGGPEDHAMYDHMSYDTTLNITRQGEHYRFTYQEDYQRTIYTDNRSRSVSVSGLEDLEDFSLGHWEEKRFVVEGFARDGGFTNETYTFTKEGQLKAELYIHPNSFQEPITLTRVYDRRSEETGSDQQ